MAQEQAAGGKQEQALPPLRMLFPNLPVQPTPLIGREYELEVASALLQRSEVRLLTLTGPGGVGKTRLALQLVANLQDTFADGVCFIPLASIREAAYLLNTRGTHVGTPSLRVKREVPEKSDRTQTKPVARNGYFFGWQPGRRYSCQHQPTEKAEEENTTKRGCHACAQAEAPRTHPQLARDSASHALAGTRSL